MKPNIFFSAFEPLHEVPEVCDICKLNPPALSYEFETALEAREPEERKGFCCRWCAAELLHKLERAATRRWAEEEAALKVDEFDVTDFRERRLAAFPSHGNSSEGSLRKSR
jgi:hypothetical protein